MKVVCIGGGKGLASAIEAWRMLDADVTAIVATTDNGGCSGRLRNAGSPVPWGDLRKALFAMSPKDNALLGTMGHRYAALGQLSGHCLGNLMLEACYQQSGSVTQAVQKVSEQLNAKGMVLPMSEESVDLLALTNSGRSVVGETNIDNLEQMPAQVMLTRAVAPPNECVTAIEQADLICVGPGSLLTSIMPVLLVEEIQHALARFSGIKLFIHNIDYETGPAGLLTHRQTINWLSSQCAEQLINSQLTRTHLVLEGETVRLPRALRTVPASANQRHDVLSLSDAFKFLSSYAAGRAIAKKSVVRSEFSGRTVFGERFPHHGI